MTNSVSVIANQKQMSFNGIQIQSEGKFYGSIAVGLSLGQKTCTFTEGLLKMPQQETTQQIQKIILLGGRICGQCDVVMGNLAKKGLVAEKRIIDPDNPAHQKFRDEAVKRGDTSAPIICIEDKSGELRFFGAGVAYIHILRLAAREKDFQEARQKRLVNA